MKIVREEPRSTRLRIVRSPSPSAGEPPQAGTSRFFNAHVHSQYSVGDAISPVSELVSKAAKLGQPAIALTDHGNMGGVVQLYQACKEEGIAPFPGCEIYFVEDREDKKAKRFHLGLLAFTTEGYQYLNRVISHSHKRENFHHKPLLDLNDFAEFKERGWTNHIALTTGCFFGWVIQGFQDELETAADRILTLKAFFPHTYVELQHHNTPRERNGIEDGTICTMLFESARELGLPTIITNDCHYTDLSDKETHDHLKRLVTWGEDPDDAVFPGDGYHLCDEQWMVDHHQPAHYDAGVEGLQDLLSKHNLTIHALDNYHYRVPKTVDDPMARVKEHCIYELDNRGLGEEYFDRLDEELDVIQDAGMSGYMWLVKEVTDWCRDHGVFYLARGSASGSLVCWLLGITQLDPLVHSLRFDRFLSRDRTKPPDIDLDIEDTKRDELVSWLESRFNLCHIGTFQTYSVDSTTGRGSLIVAYKSKIKKETGEAPEINAFFDIPEADRRHLVQLSDQEVRKSYGVHAAGLVVTSTAKEFEDLCPTMLVASSNTTVTHYEMDDVEALGLVKLDILGNRNLATLRRTVELMGREVKDGFDWIPLNDGPSFTMLRRGDTEGVFQLEGWTAAKGCREMKVRNLKDVIHILALYRPAVMNSGTKDTYIKRKAGWEPVNYLDPLFEKHFSETYGLPIFQEQTIGVLRDLGFSAEELTKLLKAVKASNKKVAAAQKVIEGFHKQFNQLALEGGLDAQAREWMWNVIEGFAEYGFNKAHATAYGLLSVRMAYLKKNHPLEFAAALLETSVDDKKKHPGYVVMVRKELEIPLLRPHVNVSGASYTLDRKLKAIRRGLVTIKGVGSKAADEIEANAPYSSITDLVERTDNRAVTGKAWLDDDRVLNGTLKILHEAGALEELPEDDDE